ncbi:5'-deoxynucleotidase [Gynuella sunshinyii]|uniref:Putative hydrolase of HD superfamily n=1 Tax=Gynuella sunshinyii YC6258 TaxID=1445510 RepID=A0A0C5VK58_9GAMM|nr:5'-deoxynucleotidase [Gynuella sunshinyii]AJQ94661.1 putative hydrolase of HD superfamily [Gynuella sunshinyii YC6258]
MSYTSRFFAYLNRLSLIKRWGLMHNTVSENVMEHSWQVATIAHTLGVIGKDIFGKEYQPEMIATAALYHDCSEIITGDMPSPIKYYSGVIADAYKAIENEAEQQLLALLPDKLKPEFKRFLVHENIAPHVKTLVKAADLISAYLKCQQELDRGNSEFKTAAKEIERTIRELELVEVDYFMATFVESYQLTLDELLAKHDSEN